MNPLPTSRAADVNEPGRADTASPMARLRARPDNPHLLRGFGPLAVGVLLLALIVLLAPTVAPEQIVERPKPTVTTVTAP